MKKTQIIIFIFIILVEACFAYWSITAKELPRSKVVARINNYYLTVDDFKDKSTLLKLNYMAGDTDKIKNDLLEEMIMKNILIQEAQTQNFDKDEAFMKEIERYWEQALLKLLMKRKIEEFATKMRSGDGAERRVKVQQMLDKWVSELRKRAKISINKDTLKKIELK
jgi:hypothetical protein